jgi:hypothetical protein
MGDLGEK